MTDINPDINNNVSGAEKFLKDVDEDALMDTETPSPGGFTGAPSRVHPRRATITGSQSASF